RQVLAGLYELLRGFQAADDLRQGELLREVLARDPDQVYAGLLTVLLRLVFLLYAEDRGLMSDGEVYGKHYSVVGLFERLPGGAGTRWTSATGPGPSCWSSSAWSTTAAGTASCTCRRGTATCSAPTATPSSKVGRLAPRASRGSDSARPRCLTGWSSACCKT